MLLPTPLLLLKPSPSHVIARTWNTASVTHPAEPRTFSSSSTLLLSSSTGSSLLTRNNVHDASVSVAAADNSQILQLLSRYKPQTDTVKRVIDSSTIQLTSGYVTLDTVRGAGTTFVMPECLDKAPAYKLKGLLMKGTAVKVYDLTQSSDNNITPKRVWIVRSSDELIVNRELVKSGYAFVRKGARNASNNINIPQSAIQELNQLEMNARRDGLGIFKICDSPNSNTGSQQQQQQSGKNGDTSTSDFFIAEFEPLEYTTQTKWSDDGGTTVLVSSNKQSPQYSISKPPNNPGDVKGCSDFDTYEDALGYYEQYYPYYGDVAKLDRRGNGVPCSGLPHTKNMERYRMKRPNSLEK
jgi:endonuclease YncB( thermonuclease family)